MVAFLEMVGALALLGLLLYRAVLALSAWIRTRTTYTAIPRRLYRRSLQHALSSRLLLARLGLYLVFIVVWLLVKTGILIPGLLCLLLVMDLLWSMIPPVVLVSSGSETQASSIILREVVATAQPMKTVHFLRDRRAGAEHLRTVDSQYWEEAYGSFADFVPLIVIDCSMVTDHLVNEASYVLNPLRRWKVLFVCGASGECPLLGCIGLDPWPDPTVTVVQQLELRAAVMERLRVGRSVCSPSAIRSRRGAGPRSFPSGQPTVQHCEICSRPMRVIEFSGTGALMLSRRELTTGIGVAEQCWECGRLYCDRCYPAREPNTCPCGQGRDAVRHIGGMVYRGSLRLVKVEYMELQRS